MVFKLFVFEKLWTVRKSFEGKVRHLAPVLSHYFSVNRESYHRTSLCPDFPVRDSGEEAPGGTTSLSPTTPSYGKHPQSFKFTLPIASSVGCASPSAQFLCHDAQASWEPAQESDYEPEL